MGPSCCDLMSVQTDHVPLRLDHKGPLARDVYVCARVRVYVHVPVCVCVCVCVCVRRRVFRRTSKLEITEVLIFVSFVCF